MKTQGQNVPVSTTVSFLFLCALIPIHVYIDQVLAGFFSQSIHILFVCFHTEAVVIKPDSLWMKEPCWWCRDRQHNAHTLPLRRVAARCSSEERNTNCQQDSTFSKDSHCARLWTAVRSDVKERAVEEHLPWIHQNMSNLIWESKLFVKFCPVTVYIVWD